MEAEEGEPEKWQHEEMEEQSHEPRTVDDLQKLENTSEWILPEGFQKKHMPANVLILAE